MDTHSGRGRLSAEREAEVYVAVLDELIENGYDKFSHDSLAQRAKCSKATLYRNWDGKQDLVLCAFAHDKATHKEVDIDRGSLRADLHAWADVVCKDSHRSSQLLLVIAHACNADPELAQAARTMLNESPEGDRPDAITRAIARGEIDPDSPALDYLLLTIAGPLVLFHLLYGDDLRAEQLKGYLDSVVLPSLALPAGFSAR